jgi:glycosyltransferase involved in cell wall biosynthesis
MNTRPTIVILLSTYNGEHYLKEQLDSLFGQSYREFILLVRDDGSSDGTENILADYAIRYPEKMQIVRDEAGNLGASGSFSWLMQYALEQRAELKLDSLYLMFCDQDDTWYEDKIARQVNAMVSSEAELTVPTPVLVHSDLQVVASDNTPIAESLADYQGLETGRNRFANMVISNLVTGCTALINEPLARRALPVPPEAIMHDWWLALVASAFGKVVYLDTPLIHYRQHGNNTIGAKERDAQGVGSLGFWRKVFGPAANEHLIEVARQAAVFKTQFAADLNTGQRRALRMCAGMGVRVGFVQRVFYRLARRF